MLDAFAQRRNVAKTERKYDSELKELFRKTEASLLNDMQAFHFNLLSAFRSMKSNFRAEEKWKNFHKR